jgi:hypothetical protein
VLAEKRAGALPPLSRLGRLLFVPERAVRERMQAGFCFATRAAAPVVAIETCAMDDR